MTEAHTLPALAAPAESTPATTPAPAQKPVEPPDPVLEAFRTELCSYVKEPLTSKSLRQILQVAGAARELLAVRNPKNRYRGQQPYQGGMYQNGGNSGYGMANPAYGVGDDDEDDTGFQMTPGRMNIDRETFGARILREIVAVIPQVLRASREDQTQIVQAIAAAEKLGMTDLAESLKARLLPDAPKPEPAPVVAAEDVEDLKKAIWAARPPGSSEYVVGPTSLDVVKELSGPECEIVNTETDAVLIPAHPNPVGMVGLQGDWIP